MLLYFQHVLNAEPYTPVDSNVTVIDRAGLFSIDAGTLFVNGIDVGQSASVVPSDVVSLRYISGDSDIGTFITYSIGTDIGVWAVATPSKKLFFDFAQPFSVMASSVCRSSQVILSDNQVTVKTIGQNSQLLRNGVLVGDVAVFNFNDVLEIEYTAPSSFDTDFQVLIFVGSNFSQIRTKTAPKRLVPGQVVFDSILDAPLATLCSSNEILVSGIDDFVSVSSDASIIKNGVNVGFSSTVYDGDVLKLQAFSSSKSNDFKFYSLLLGPRRVSWTVRTSQSGNDKITRPEFLYKHPFDSAPFSPNFSLNRLVKIDSTVTEFSFDAPTLVESRESHVFVTDFFQDCLFVMDRQTGATLFSTTLNKPYGATFSPRFSLADEDKIAYKFVTLSGADQVAVLDPQASYAVMRSISVPGRPMGIDSDANGFLWVAAFDLGVVYKIDPFNTANIVSFSVGGKPLEVMYADNFIYVSDVENRRVLVLDTDGTIIRQYKTGSNPWGMAKDAIYLYVADSADNTITKINTMDYSQHRISTASRPSSIACLNGNLYVACSGVNIIQKIDATSGELLENISVSQRPSAITTDGQAVYAVLTYNTMPEQVGFDSETGLLSVEPITNVPVNSDVESGPVTLSAGRALYVPGPSVITVNGIQVANGTFVYPGDDVAVSIKSSVIEGETCAFPLFFGNAQYNFNVTTTPDTKPDPVYFLSQFNQRSGFELVSNEVILSGISSGYQSDINFDGILVVNGVEFANSASVKNGDLLAIKVKLQVPYSSTYTYYVTHNDEPFAALKVYMLTLNGPAPHDDFNRWLAKVGMRFNRFARNDYEIDAASFSCAHDSLQESDLSQFDSIKRLTHEANASLPKYAQGSVSLAEGKNSTFNQASSFAWASALANKSTGCYRQSNTASFIYNDRPSLWPQLEIILPKIYQGVFHYVSNRQFLEAHDTQHLVLNSTKFRLWYEHSWSSTMLYSNRAMSNTFSVDSFYSSRPVWLSFVPAASESEKLSVNSFVFERSPDLNSSRVLLWSISPQDKQPVKDIKFDSRPTLRRTDVATFDSAQKFSETHAIADFYSAPNFYGLRTVEFESKPRLNSPITREEVGQSFVKKITQVCNFRPDAILAQTFGYVFHPSFKHQVDFVHPYDSRPLKIDFDFDTSPEKACGFNGLFISEADALRAGQEYVGASALKLSKCWTWVVPSDKSIVCLVPSEGSGVYPVGGYLSGG